MKQYWKTIGWFLVMCYLLFTPAKNLPKSTRFDIPHFDKIIHISMFLILVFIVHFDAQLNKNMKRFLGYISIIIAFGILSEIIQYHFIAGRSGNIFDFIADVVGITLGTLTFKIFSSRKKRYATDNL